MIIHNIAQFIALKYYRIGERFKHKSEMISIFDQINNAQNICVLTPMDEQEIGFATDFIAQIPNLFSKAGGIVVTPSPSALPGLQSGKFETVVLDPQKSTFWGMPDKDVKNRLRLQPFDLVLDLSIGFNFYNTSLMWHCETPLRIGFNHPKRDKLYNFVIRLREEAKGPGVYKTLETYLGVKSP